MQKHQVIKLCKKRFRKQKNSVSLVPLMKQTLNRSKMTLLKLKLLPKTIYPNLQPRKNGAPSAILATQLTIQMSQKNSLSNLVRLVRMMESSLEKMGEQHLGTLVRETRGKGEDAA